MPTLAPSELTLLARAILEAAGTPDDIAQCVADSLVDANLKGVDSHGVMRLEWYLEQIRDGVILPAARPSPQLDKGTAAIVSGNGAFGVYGMTIAADVAVAEAPAHDLP